MSLTVDEALRFADQQYTKQSFAGVLTAEVRRLSAENAATVRDAERYRWMCANIDKAQMDAAIDAVRGAK